MRIAIYSASKNNIRFLTGCDCMQQDRDHLNKTNQTKTSFGVLIENLECF